MKPETDETLTRAIIEGDLRLRCGLARHTPGVRIAQLFALSETTHAYAEGQTLDEAFEILADNHREAVNVLACRGTVLGGAPPTDGPDAHVRSGGTIEARRDVEQDVEGVGYVIVAELSELVIYRTPADVGARVRETGVAERHEQRGLTYETVREKTGSVITRCVSEWTRYPWSWTERQTGIGPSLADAITAAFAAAPVEIAK